MKYDAAPPATPALNLGHSALLIFVSLRLALLMTLPAGALFEYGDYRHHYNLAVWSVPGQCPAGPEACWPLLDYWYEYPPLFGYLSVGLVGVLGNGTVPPYHAYAYALALILLAADLGNLLLLRRIAGRLYGAAVGDWSALVYAAAPAPIILSGWTFDGLTTFWVLLGLWALLQRRDGLAAVAISLGALTKLVPVLLLPALVRARPPRRAAAVVAGVAVLCALVLAPFVWRSPAMALASLRSQFTKSSYATVWAMLDGNLMTAAGQPITGNFGPLVERFDPALATVPQHRPAAVPGVLPLAAAGLALGVTWLQSWRGRRPWTDLDSVRLTALTWAVFVLWSRGWSPQWQHTLVPLLLLTAPNRAGWLAILLLAGVSFLEWPVLLARGLAWGYWLTISLRTALFIGWAIYLARALWRRPAAGVEARA